MQNSLYISNSKFYKRSAKVIVFALVLILVLKISTEVLSVKFTDGIAQWDVFYEIEENTLDVLVIGSSHAYVNINPVVMYDKEGIAAFNLCASMQPMWNSYYFIKEALKYQTPELIILEGYGTCYNDNYTEYGENTDIAPRVIKNNFGMKWSLTKLQSIITSVPKERRGEFIIELMQTHNRYESLNESDFKEIGKYPEGKTWRGQADRMDSEINEYPEYSILQETGTNEMTPKTEEYYRKILQLAQDEGIPLCVVLTPYPSIKDTDKRTFNTAKLIAEEYGADFVDFNTAYFYEDIGLDFATDYADVVHMNNNGNEKFSTYFADYLISKYSLPDRRGNETYIDWESEVEVRKQNVLNNAIEKDVSSDN